MTHLRTLAGHLWLLTDRVPAYALTADDTPPATGTPIGRADRLVFRPGPSGVELAIGDTPVGTVAPDEHGSALFLVAWMTAMDHSGSATPGLREFLHLHTPDYYTSTRLLVAVCLWNVAGLPVHGGADEPLQQWLGPPADLVVVLLQEAVPLASGPVAGSAPYAAWRTRLDALLSLHVCVGEARLVGLATYVYAAASVALQLVADDVTTIPTGLFGVYGNKGGVVMLFRVGVDPVAGAKAGASPVLVFANCHLAAGDAVDQRRKELGIIVDAVDGVAPNHNALRVIHGDLNFRLSNSDTAGALIDAGNVPALFALDTLTPSLPETYTEAPVTFLPTYKRHVGGGGYDMLRTPAYTDRVVARLPEAGVQTEYTLVPAATLSDHVPVRASFTVPVQLVDWDKRDGLVRTYFKEHDAAENSSRPVVTIAPLETTCELFVLSPSTTTVTITNGGLREAEFEFVDPAGGAEHVGVAASGDPLLTVHVPSTPEQVPCAVSVAPFIGRVPAGEAVEVELATTLAVGAAACSHTWVVRIRGGLDVFVSTSTQARPLYFGQLLDQLPDHGGIPQPLQTLMGYLTHHPQATMWDSEPDAELAVRVRECVDSGRELEQEFSAAELADEELVPAVAAALVLLVRHLDHGVVGPDEAEHVLSQVPRDAEVERWDATTFVLEALPGLRANVLVYVCAFLRVVSAAGVPERSIERVWSDLLISIPNVSARRRRALEEKRRVLLSQMW